MENKIFIKKIDSILIEKLDLIQLKKMEYYNNLSIVYSFFDSIDNTNVYYYYDAINDEFFETNKIIKKHLYKKYINNYNNNEKYYNKS